MALNFPDNPSVNDIYRDSTSGFSYQWDGTVWQSYSDSSLGQIQVLDDISGSFNSSTQTFALTSSSTAITPANAQQIRVVLGGVVQDPADDYTVSGSNITFTTPPAGGLSFSGVVFGTAVPINTITDGSVTEGSLRISTKAVVGAATTFTEDLVVNGNARVVGVLTVGTSSIILNGNDSTITASAFVGDGSGLTGAGSTVVDDTTTNATFYPLFTDTTSGTVTASKVSTSKLSFNPSTGTLSATGFSGDGSGLTGAGSTVADDTTTNATFYPLFTQTTTGTVTASNVSTTKLTFNPSSGTVSATTFSGALSGNSTTASGLQTSRTINGISFDGSTNIITNPSSGAYSNGYGARTVQSGGSASGGSSGDIYYIY